MTVEAPDTGPTAGEWADQEEATRLERSGRTATSNDARVAAYRVVARTLSEPLTPALPSNFSWYVAELARAAAGEWGAEDRRFRRRLYAALVATLSLTAGALLARFGGDWLLAPAVQSSPSLAWGLVIVASVAGGRLVESLVRRRGA